MIFYEKTDTEANVINVPLPETNNQPDQPVFRGNVDYHIPNLRNLKRKFHCSDVRKIDGGKSRKQKAQFNSEESQAKRRRTLELETSIESQSSSDEQPQVMNKAKKRKKILRGGKKMHKEMKKMKMSERCTVCQESWFDMKIGPRTKRCDRCTNEKRNTKETEFPTYSLENDLIPSETPEELKRLNYVELCAIKLVCPMMTFYKRQSGSHGSRGNCVSFEQDVGTFAEELIQLPRPPEELPIVILTSA